MLVQGVDLDGAGGMLFGLGHLDADVDLTVEAFANAVAARRRGVPGHTLTRSWGSPLKAQLLLRTGCQACTTTVVPVVVTT